LKRGMFGRLNPGLLLSTGLATGDEFPDPVPVPSHASAFVKVEMETLTYASRCLS